MNKSMKLRCPHCAGRLSVMMESRGQAYMTYDAPSGFECDDCYREWDIYGDPIGEDNG